MIQKYQEVYENVKEMNKLMEKKSNSFISMIRITGKTPADGNTKNVEITVALKYFFWRTLEKPFINCKVNLILTCSETCVISSATGKTKIAITYTKLYILLVTLLTQDNT